MLDLKAECGQVGGAFWLSNIELFIWRRIWRNLKSLLFNQCSLFNQLPFSFSFMARIERTWRWKPGSAREARRGRVMFCCESMNSWKSFALLSERWNGIFHWLSASFKRITVHLDMFEAEGRLGLSIFGGVNSSRAWWSSPWISSGSERGIWKGRCNGPDNVGVVWGWRPRTPGNRDCWAQPRLPKRLDNGRWRGLWKFRSKLIFFKQIAIWMVERELLVHG